MQRFVVKTLKRGGLAVCLALLCLVVAVVFSDKPELFPEQTHSRAFYDRNGKLLRLTLSHDEQYRLWTPLKDIPLEFQQATLLYEDKYFYRHFGVNPIALVRATYSSYLSSGRRMGASTITMQLARLRFGLQTTTVIGKLKQIKHALDIERHYTKDEILEAYLNLAPYGHNIQGVAAASVIYFQKPVQEMSFSESLILAVVPQNPNKRLPSTTSGFQYSDEARGRLLELWKQEYGLDSEVESRLTLPLRVSSPTKLPYYAPHTVDSLLTEVVGNSEHVFQTSLDLNMQKKLERLAENYIEQKQSIGLNNTAAMILDTRTMQVVSELGSVRYFDADIQGQVNGARALRSPGSTLKPFIFALAMEQGIIHPQSILKDAPKRFGAYTPENYDEYFAGPLSATDALVRSRNIPAVTLLQKLDGQSFHSWLSQFDLEQLFVEDHYGLALALGGNEVTMLELVELYASLANLGEYRKAKYLLSNEELDDKSKNVLTPESAYLTLKMLTHNASTDRNHNVINLQAAGGRDFKKNVTPWKTGTSFAFRDAWSVGVVGHYVVAVWVGNFDGTGNPALTGRKAAAPLFFQIARYLQSQEPNMQASWQYANRNLNVRRIPICKSSGDLALEHCPDPISGWFIPGVSPIKTHSRYREVLIDVATGLRACEESEVTVRRVYPFWESDVEAVFAQSGIKLEQVPNYLPSCEEFSLQAKLNDELSITSPLVDLDYVLQADKLAEEEIPLTAVTDADANELYWFVANQFVGKSSPSEPLLWQAKLGEFDVTVIDDKGRTDRVKLKTTLVN